MNTTTTDVARVYNECLSLVNQIGGNQIEEFVLVALMALASFVAGIWFAISGVDQK